MKYSVQTYFEPITSTLTYIVYDESSRNCVVIDPVWNLEYASGKLSSESVNQVLEFCKTKELEVRAVLETHIHADHVTGAQLVKEKYPQALVCIGSKIADVQKYWHKIYDLPTEVPTDGRQFDKLLNDGESIEFGNIAVKVLHTSGHTPACATYVIGEDAFVGDAIFMPDSGTGRCDFPGGDAHQLFRSVSSKIFSLPENTRLHVGHDYQPGGRELRSNCTVKEQKTGNIHIRTQTTEAEFVKFRTERDKTLSAPKLLLPSLQVNLNGGMIPLKNSKGEPYLRIPLKA